MKRLDRCSSHAIKRGRALVVLASIVLVVTACASERRQDRSECCPCGQKAGKRLDEALMSTLAMARSYHHQADLYLQQKAPQKAIAAMRSLLALKLDARWPEAEEARLDAAARLAKLLATQGQEEAALALTERHIKQASRPSFYLANLFAMRGDVLEGRSKRLDKEGQKERAQAAARRALAAFERSIAINKKLQSELRKKEQPHGK